MTRNPRNDMAVADRQTVSEAMPFRKVYATPKLVEWGAMADLTAGQAGDNQDESFTGTVTFGPPLLPQ